MVVILMMEHLKIMNKMVMSVLYQISYSLRDFCIRLMGRVARGLVESPM